MTDWTEHLARGRRWAEAAFWILAAVMVALSLAAGTALALWLDVSAGTKSAQEITIIIDLNALPPVEALAELPPVEEVTAEPEPEPAPEPPPVIKAAIPDPLAPDPLAPVPEVKPEPKVERKPDPRPKPEVKPKAKKEAKPKAEPKPKKTAKAETRMQAGAVGSKASKGKATANARAKWHAKVQSQLTRQLQKKSFKAKGTKLTLRIKVAADGSFSAAVASSSGKADLDAAVMAQLRRLGRLAVPPDGQAETLRLPVVLR